MDRVIKSFYCHGRPPKNGESPDNWCSWYLDEEHLKENQKERKLGFGRTKKESISKLVNSI